MLWCAAVAAAILMDRGFKRAGIKADAVTMVAFTVIAGIVGAKLWHVIDTPAEFRDEGWRVLWDSAGFAWFGGLVFGLAALVFQGWWARIGSLRTLDLAAPSAAIGWWLWKRAGKPYPTGWILGEYLVLSGLARFLVEFIRRNPKILWGLSNAQLASAGSVLAGIVLLIWAASRKAARPEDARRSAHPAN